MTRKLDFNEVAAMRFVDEATRVAATPRFSGEGHPDVADTKSGRTLFYSYVNRGRQHSRLVILGRDAATNAFRLISETQVTPPGGIKVDQPVSAKTPKPPSEASRLPSACRKVVEAPDTAEERLRTGRRVHMAFEVGSTVTVNGEEVEVTGIKTFYEGKTMLDDAKVTSWGLSLSNGLFIEVGNKQTRRK